MLEMLLIRHGQTDWNAARRVMGRQPIPLNERGRAQAEGVAEYLAEVRLDAIVSSPVLRTMETAGIIAAHHPGLAVEPNDGLSEIDYGEWVNLTFAELEEHHGESWRRYLEDPNDLVLPGGESMPEVVARVARLLEKLKTRFMDPADPQASKLGSPGAASKRVALVSHADIIKILLLNLLGLDVRNVLRLSIDNCALLLVRISAEMGARLVLFNMKDGFARDTNLI